MGFLTWNTKLNGDISRIGFNPSPLKLSQSFKPLPKGEGRVSLIFLFPLLVGEGAQRAGEGGSSAARDMFFMPATSEFGYIRQEVRTPKCLTAKRTQDGK